MNSSFYPAIFERKSIRKYDETPLTGDQLALVKTEMEAATPLLPGEKFKLELNPAKEGWRIYGYCENTSLGNVNLGYVLQQLDLALHVAGFGRLWYGFGRAPRDVKAPKGLSYAMCLKIGVSAEPLTRELSEFDRQASIVHGENKNLAELLEPARLAPSAMNSQPWLFSGDASTIHVWRKQLGIKKLFLGRMNLIDVGISLCHAILAIEHANKAFTVEVNTPAQSIADYDYLLTLRIN